MKHPHDDDERDDGHGDDDDDLAEYRALVGKVDDAVARAADRAGDQLTCRSGCASCCVDGLSVLPVEAFALAAAVEARVAAGHDLPAVRPTDDACVFLDVDNRCAVYEARPLLCRTHGLPLVTGEPARGALRIVDDVSVCALNFPDRLPTRADALDAGRLLQLLVTVDRRFRARVGLPDDAGRIPLRDVAADVRDDGQEPDDGRDDGRDVRHDDGRDVRHDDGG